MNPFDGTDFFDNVFNAIKGPLGTLFDDIGAKAHPVFGDTGGFGQDDGRFHPLFNDNPFVSMMSLPRNAPAQATGPTVNTAALLRPNSIQRALHPTATAPVGVDQNGEYVYDSPLDAPNDPLTQQIIQMARAEAASQRIDPEIFLRLIKQESNFNPNITSKAGAHGLTQLMPGTAQGLGVKNINDPKEQLRGGATYVRQMLDRYGGDYRKALAAYNAGPGAVDQYGDVPPYQETQTYVNTILAGAKRREAAQTPPAAAAAGVNRPLQGLTVYQYGQESLDTGAADYICGPIAAQAFVKSEGRNPTLQESLNMARQLGVIDSVNGMHGIESTARLIRSLGGQATVGDATPQQLIQDLQAGRPVIVNTQKHYFVAEGFDAATGKFDFGNSARTLASIGPNGNTWYTLQEVGRLGMGAVQGAIYAR